MPGIAIHGVIATRLLDAWPASTAVPLRVENPCVRNAFRAGAMGPDMGYAPGGARFVSDLAHYVRGSDLFRVMLDRARGDEETAFAWGWASHVLADVAIHPLVNRAVGERLTGEAGRSISFHQDNSMHIRIEAGLDAGYLAAHDAPPTLSFQPVFDARSAAMLTGAFDAIYGVGVASHTAVLRSHRRASAASRMLEAIVSLTAGRPRTMRLRAWAVLAGAAQRFTAIVAPRGPTHAFTHTFPPTAALLRQTTAEVDALVGHFFDLVNGQVHEYPNYNLDLGVEEHAAEYVPREAVLAALPTAPSPCASHE